MSNLRATYKCVVLTVTGAIAAVAVAAPLTTGDGVITAAQVARGKAVYDKSCANCHPTEFYRDRMTVWESKPVAALFESISATMPQDNPGSLLTSEYLDALAYIFSVTGSPTGSTELTAENMEKINVAPVK